jgi:hypothetical protein
LNAGQLEEIAPHVSSEHRIAVTDNRRRKSMEANNTFEESLSNGEGRVWMAQRNEMRILGEAIHDRQDDALAINPWEALNEIHRDVCPHR